jgi:hypothetical protein
MEKRIFMVIEMKNEVNNTDMDGLTIISESLESLQDLLKRETIFLDDVPKQLKADLQKFIVGETLTMQNGKIVIGNKLYKRWLLKLNTKGFDYEIDWKQ